MEQACRLGASARAGDLNSKPHAWRWQMKQNRASLIRDPPVAMAFGARRVDDFSFAPERGEISLNIFYDGSEPFAVRTFHRLLIQGRVSHTRPLGIRRNFQRHPSNQLHPTSRSPRKA